MCKFALLRCSNSDYEPSKILRWFWWSWSKFALNLRWNATSSWALKSQGWSQLRRDARSLPIRGWCCSITQALLPSLESPRPWNTIQKSSSAWILCSSLWTTSTMRIMGRIFRFWSRISSGVNFSLRISSKLKITLRLFPSITSRSW